MTLEITKSQRQHQLIQSDNIGYSFQINSFRYRVKLLLQLFICLSVFTLLAAISWPSAATDIAPNPRESDLSSPPPKATTSASNPVTLNQVEAGQLLFDTEIQGQFRQALNMHNEVNFQINGMVATVHLRQSFKNNSLDWLNGVYVFPLPDAAAVYKMQLEIGDRIIQGEIKEKQQAKKIYQEAKKAGKKVSLVSQQRPNLFSNKIANIGPGETVTVALSYSQSVRYNNGQFSLRFPMTITPRYIPGQTFNEGDNPLEHHSKQTMQFENVFGWAQNTPEVPDAKQITPFLNPRTHSETNPINPISISAELNAGILLKEINSPYHDISISRQNNQYHIELADQQTSMNRDFVLSWRPTAESQPQAAIFSQTVGQDSFLQIMLLPPNEKNSEQELARELIFVIDTSGSMAGQSIDQAKQSLQLALIQLRTIDRFNIIEFNSRTHSLFKNPKSANRDTLLKAKKFVHRLQAKGGTEMAPALNTAFKSQHSEQHVRQIIFITDGAVGNEQTIYKIIHNALADGRLYTIGIGSAPNSYFMRKAAQFGRGTFLHIGSSQQVETKMNQLFDKIKRPLATQLTIKWPQELNIETFPNRLPDLHRGEPVLVNAKIKQGLPHHGIEFSIHGVTKHNQQLKPWQKNLSLQQVGNHRGISKLWAQKKIESLLDKKIAGGDGDIGRQQVLEVALRHQLTSPYTSFIAVEKQISKPTGAHSVTKPITNAPPHGQARQTYAFPATATSAPLNILIGLLLISLALMIRKTTSKGYKVVG